MKPKSGQLSQLALIDLDVLLDTRLPILNRLVPVLELPEFVATYAVGNYKRFSDLAPSLTPKAFADAWAERGKAELQDARPSQLLTQIGNALLNRKADSIKNPDTAPPELVVNFYPYVLTNAEATAIKEALLIIFPMIDKVEMIRQKPGSLGPRALKDKYQEYWMVDFNDWLELHHESLKDVPIPGVLIRAAELLKASDEEMEKFKEALPEKGKFLKDVSPAETMRQLMTPVVGLDFYPAKLLAFKPA